METDELRTVRVYTKKYTSKDKQGNTVKEEKTTKEKADNIKQKQETKKQEVKKEEDKSNTTTEKMYYNDSYGALYHPFYKQENQIPPLCPFLFSHKIIFHQRTLTDLLKTL